MAKTKVPKLRMCTDLERLIRDFNTSPPDEASFIIPRIKHLVQRNNPHLDKYDLEKSMGQLDLDPFAIEEVKRYIEREEYRLGEAKDAARKLRYDQIHKRFYCDHTHLIHRSWTTEDDWKRGIEATAEHWQKLLGNHYKRKQGIVSPYALVGDILDHMLFTDGGSCDLSRERYHMSEHVGREALGKAFYNYTKKNAENFGLVKLKKKGFIHKHSLDRFLARVRERSDWDDEELSHYLGTGTFMIEDGLKVLSGYITYEQKDKKHYFITLLSTDAKAA